MTTLQAWQHIFSNVEKAQSPKGQGGFQTLFYTAAGLTADEISEMEGRLLYFPDKTHDPIKRVFFITTTGKAVVAQLVVLPEPDQFGRKGRYLAHALAFTLEDFAKFEADPFRVFRSFTFFTTVDQALAQGDFQSGDIATVTVNVGQGQDVKAAKQWSTAELKKLSLLALRVEQQTQNREAITFAGEPEVIEQALEAAFLTVPIALRSRCMFDTYFYRCNLVATFYWAIGFLDQPVSIKFALVDGVTRQVQGLAPTQPETAYERWVLAELDSNRLPEIAQQREVAFALGEWLDDRPHQGTLLDTASPTLMAEVFKVNGEGVQAFLRRRIGECLPADLVGRASVYVYQKSSLVELYHHLRQGFTIAPLVEVLYASYEADHFADPGRGEVKALQTVLGQAEHGLLQLFVAYWRSTRRHLPAALAKASEDDYQKFVDIALRLALVKPLTMLLSQWVDAFLDIYLKSEVEDWVGLVEQLIEIEALPALAQLTPFMAQRSRKELNGLDRLVAEQEAAPESLRQAITSAMDALPPEGGLKGFIKSAFSRLPGIGSD